MTNPSHGLYLLQDGTHAEPGSCAADPAGVLRHTESNLVVCTYEDGTPQTVGQDAINNMNVAAANPIDPTAQLPVIAALQPASCTIGSPDFTLIVDGTGFTAASVIRFAGHDEPTTFNDVNASLSTGVKPSLWEAPVVVQCSVRNGAAQSNLVDFEFLAQGVTQRSVATPPSSPAAAKPEEPKPKPDGAPARAAPHDPHARPDHAPPHRG